jgi:EAL domain-containing protein (putative c-di-GMP-specific phosphodiesterase class I)
LNLPNWAESICKEYGVPTSRVTIELTENANELKLDNALEVLIRLGIKGFKLSLDDFGTEMSNFDRLQTLPFSELKIDRKLITDIDKSQAKRSAVQAIATLAHDSNISVVAEGVESWGNWSARFKWERTLFRVFILPNQYPMTMSQRSPTVTTARKFAKK